MNFGKAAQIAIIASCLALSLTAQLSGAFAQTNPPAGPSSQLEQITVTPDLRKQTAPAKPANTPESRFTTGLVTGSPQSTDLAITYQIATALAVGQETGPNGEMALRVLPMIGNSGIRNIVDVLALPGADMAIAPVILVNRARDTKELGDLRNKLVYIMPLFPEEFHLIARADINTIRDLAGKSVNLGVEGSAAAVLGREVFTRLGLKINEVNVDFDSALDDLRSGEISAFLIVSGKPVKSLPSSMQADGFHFIAIPYSPADMQLNYLPSNLQHEDYPDLIKPGETIETISTSSALWAYNWPERSDRYRLLDSFVRTLFDRFQEFQIRPHHPKWREVNLAAVLSGWKRFRPAEIWLEQHAPATSELWDEFERFLSAHGNTVAADHKRVFEEFLNWRKQNSGN